MPMHKFDDKEIEAMLKGLKDLNAPAGFKQRVAAAALKKERARTAFVFSIAACLAGLAVLGFEAVIAAGVKGIFGTGSSVLNAVIVVPAAGLVDSVLGFFSRLVSLLSPLLAVYRLLMAKFFFGIIAVEAAAVFMAFVLFSMVKNQWRTATRAAAMLF
jgi:hypothetical protein